MVHRLQSLTLQRLLEGVQKLRMSRASFTHDGVDDGFDSLASALVLRRIPSLNFVSILDCGDVRPHFGQGKVSELLSRARIEFLESAVLFPDGVRLHVGVVLRDHVLVLQVELLPSSEVRRQNMAQVL